MLQERWEESVLASILAFFFAFWTVRSMHRRGVHFLSFHELRGLVLVSLQCPWLVRCCPLDPTNNDDKTWFVRHCQPQESQSTDLMVPAETLASWGAAVWSADARGLGAGLAFATARGFLGNDYSNNQAEYFALIQCLFRALRLQDPHVIFEVDSLIFAKQLARHLPWACRSENLIALHPQCVHVFTSRVIFVIYTVSSTRQHERDSNVFFFAFW